VNPEEPPAGADDIEGGDRAATAPVNWLAFRGMLYSASAKSAARFSMISCTSIIKVYNSYNYIYYKIVKKCTDKKKLQIVNEYTVTLS